VPTKAGNRTVPKQTALVTTLGKGYMLMTAEPWYRSTHAGRSLPSTRLVCRNGASPRH
jgi:hypothetical protein